MRATLTVAVPSNPHAHYLLRRPVLVTGHDAAVRHDVGGTLRVLMSFHNAAVRHDVLTRPVVDVLLARHGGAVRHGLLARWGI